MIDQSKQVKLGSTKNYLLLKDDVGRPKPFTRNLPSVEFTYGKPENNSQEGAGDVTRSWQYPSNKRNDSTNNPRDFKKLNKRAVLDGMITARDNYKFRQNHDNRIPFGLEALKNKGSSIPNDSFTFGKRNRPQTPVKGIILNDYGETAGMCLQEKYRVLKESKTINSPRNNKFEIRYTHAQMKHDQYIKQRNSSLDHKPSQFKLKRFQNVEPKVGIVKLPPIRTPV